MGVLDFSHSHSYDSLQSFSGIGETCQITDKAAVLLDEAAAIFT